MLFSKKRTTNYLGIDLGRTGIKIVELKQDKNRFELLKYVLADFGWDMAYVNTRNIKDIAKLVDRMLIQAKMSSKKAIVSVPTSSVFNSVLKLPNSSITELDIIIRSEAKKLIHLPIDDVVIDWKIINTGIGIKQNILHTDFEYLKSHVKQSAQGGELSVFLTVIPRNIIKRYKDIFSLSSVQLVSMEVETLAMTRSLSFNDPACMIVIDLGGVTTSIILVDNSVPIFTKSIEVGGFNISTAIHKCTGLDNDSAEQLKKDVGVIYDMGGGYLKVAEIAEPLISKIVDEVLYVMSFYSEHLRGEKKIDKILLTGGSAFLINLDKYLSNMTDLPVYVADPWFYIDYEKDLQPLLYKIGQEMCVAIGLAMQDQKE